MRLSSANKGMLTRALALNAKLVKAIDQNLFDRMKYTSDAMKKDAKSVTRADLTDLLKDVQTALGDKFINPAMAEEMPKEPAVAPASAPTPAPKTKVAPKKTTSKKESSLKKTERKGASADSKPSTEALKQTAKKLEGKKPVAPASKKVETPAPKKSAPKKEAEKSVKSKKVEKQSNAPASTASTSNPKSVEMATMFPSTLTVDGETFSINHDVKTMADLYKLFEKEEEVILAFYWTKRHLKQFKYFNGWLGQPKSFDNDLDLVSIVFVSERATVAHGVSMYTDGVYSLLAEDIAEDGGIRFSSGIEYQIYTKK